MDTSTSKPKAVDLSHHINAKSRARHPSPLKDIIRYMNYDGMISLAGGLPHPSLFPLKDAEFNVSDPNSTGTSQEEHLKLELNNTSACDPILDAFLQYGTCEGNAALRNWAATFTQNIHKPAYSDFQVLLHPGNTNAWSKIVGLLVEEGDYILCENFTYPSSQALWIPLGNFAAPVAMDGQGIRDDSLRQLLSSWETTHPGKRRPHLLYMVSVGSNPTGVTMGAERRRKVYEVCVEYDVVIVEDDPYFFIQYPGYDIGGPKPDHSIQPNDQYLKTLAPSFLQYDYQGRVIRLESFSKSLFPGLRLGYFIANPIFSERLLRATEVETQDPSGLSQAFVLSLLKKWTDDGYITWLQKLRVQYHIRRDWLINAFAEHFQFAPAEKHPNVRAEGIVASMKDSKNGKMVPVFSFVPPTGGMFIWTRIHLSQNSRFKELQADKNENDPEQTFCNELWSKLAEALVLVTPGSYYYPWQGKDKTITSTRGIDAETTYFRFTFAMVTKEAMEQGVERFASVVRKSWQL